MSYALKPSARVANFEQQIEVVFDASHAPEVPTPKSLTERIAAGSKAQAKAKPKPATAKKAAANDSNNKRAAAGRPARGRKGQGRNPGRGKPKTVEELDAEMIDYFADTNAPADANAATNGAAPQANGGEDLGMAEIS